MWWIAIAPRGRAASAGRRWRPPAATSWPGATSPLERAIALDPSHLGALHKLARLDALEGRDAALEARAERFLRLSPDADQALAVRTLRAYRLRRIADQARLLAEFRGARALAVAAAFGDAALYAGAVDEVATLGDLLVPGIRSPELRALFAG